MTTPALVLDLDGVVYLQDQLLPGAARALAELRTRGHRYLFVTNNSTRTASQVARHIAEITELEVAEAEVVTSADAAAAHLKGRIDTVLVVGEEGLEETLRAAGIGVVADPQAAGAVVVGLDRRFDYGRLRDATTAVRRGALLVATNHDATYPTPHGLWPGGGAILAAIEAASGVTAEVCGKPHPPMRRLIRRRLSADEVWVVGDRADSDVALGQAEDWTTVLVLGGVTESLEDVPAEMRPDYVIDSLADLPGLIRSAKQ